MPLHRDLRIFIRHSVSGKYLTPHLEWTRDLDEARFFESPNEGLDFLRVQELEDVELVIKPETKREKRYSCARFRNLKP